MENLEELKEKLAQYEQREKELELRVDELTDFIENASLPLHWVNGDGIIIWANQAELDFLGYTKEEYIGKSITLFHADQDVIQNILYRLTNFETLIGHPAKLRCKDGAIKHVLINSNVLWKDGKFVHTRCFTKDITAFVNEEERRQDLVIELEESEARLRMAIESTKMGTWDYNPVTGNLYWSAECRKIFGFPLDAHLNFEIFNQHVHPDDQAMVQKEIQKSINQGDGSIYDLTYRINRYDDGSIRWVRVRGKVYINAQQVVDRFIGTVLDITESKIAQEKVAHSEKLFRSIALSIPKSLIIVFDRTHRFITIEGDIMEKMGYSKKDYAGKHPLEIAPAERYEATKPLYDRVLNGEKFSIERKASTGDDYMMHFVPLKNDAGEVDSALILALDIGDIKQAEEKSGKLAAIIDSSDDAIISKNLDGIITSWNKSAQRTFGYTEEEMIGEPIFKLIPPDKVDEETNILSRLRRGERVEHFETKRVTKDNTLLDLSLTISPIRDGQGNIIGISKIARDITEKKQEELRKNDFIAMVSHELKTPLTSMKSYIQVMLLKAKKEGDTFSINALSRADVQARKMTSMIQDFLSLARLEDGKIQLNKEVFELHPLIEEIAGDVQFLTSSHTIQLKDCEDILLNADKDKIGQVLINLVSNAIKYSPRGGNIIIGCEKQPGKVKVFVTDEGIGISSEDQKRLFERFYRVKNDKMKTISGFGIGLYLVAEVLRYHNSEIKVESKEDAGSTFYFTLDTETKNV